MELIPFLFQKSNFSKAYFTGKSRQVTDVPLCINQFSVIKTDDHFRSCKNAVSPHLLDFYMLCLIRKGEGIYRFGKDEYYLKANTLCFIQPYTLTSWHSQTAFQEGFCCTFSEDFFYDGMENKRWLKELSIPGHVVVTLTETQTSYFNMLLEDMEKEFCSGSRQDPELIKSQLRLLIRKTATLFPVTENHIRPHSGAAIELVKLFTQHCRSDFDNLISGKTASLPSLRQHADRLHVTPNYMNDTIRVVLGKSAWSYVQEELAKIASGLLMQTNLTISQVANRLGFNSASYFSRFYKKQTGNSPSEFREQYP